MPFDTKYRAKYLIDKIKPTLAIFVRYDLWFNHLNLLKSQNIPMYLNCATKTNSQLYLQNSLSRKIYLKNLNLLDKIYTAGNEHTKFFNSLNLKPNIITSGDTRFDRIIQKVEDLKSTPMEIASIFTNKLVFLAGSSWKEDEDILLEFYEKAKLQIQNLQLILVPHEPTIEHIHRLKSKQNKIVLLSEIENKKNFIEIQDKIIVVDSIGKLLQLYSIADYAFVGGAYGKGIHSVVEPAGFGIPIFFGINYFKSLDAVNLVNLQSSFSVSLAEELYDIFMKLEKDKELYKRICSQNENYLLSAKGESSRIAKEIIEMVLI
jgi:3-deoxy-D-manno-octulosonic-acid transferase